MIGQNEPGGNEIRLHQQVDIRANRQKVDSLIIEAMDHAGRTTPEGMAVTELEGAGLTLSAERCAVRSLIADLPVSSPLHKISTDTMAALGSQGYALAPRLLEMAEVHLIDGRPEGNLTMAWAKAKAKQITQQARDARASMVAPREPTTVVISRLQTQLESEISKRREAEAVAAEAIAALEALQSQQQ